MKKNCSHINLALIFVLFISNFACKKFVEIELPKDELTTEKVFADSADANAALLGVYVRMQNGFNFCSGTITTYPGMSADELYQTATTENTQFYSNTLLPTNSSIGSFWSTGYSYIYDRNACIEGVKNSATLTDAQKAVFIGEARCMRAFFYFNLVNLFGAIPLVLSTDYNITRTLPRASESEIYKQIVEDLVYAKSVLPSNIDGNIRVNKDIATALLSRVYLYTKNYTAAQAEATELINSHRYSLEAAPNDVFSPQSTETIWALISVNPGSRATQEGFNFIPSSSTRVPAYVITNTLFNTFEVTDLRKSQWIKTNTISGQPYPYPYKYKMRTPAGYTDLEKYVVLRLAEQYLIRAEAQANSNNLSQAEADVNKIRRRAGLSDFSAGNEQTLMLNEIERQRQLEYAFEWGHRWFDLKRTGRINDVLHSVKSDWNAADALYPIPQTQIERNPYLTQNNGY